MLLRAISVATFSLAMCAFAAAVNAKEDFPDGTHTGLVVSTTAEELVMTDDEGKNEHTHKITADTKVTLDSKDAAITDLKAGQKISVTIKDAKVTEVAAKSA